MLAGLKARHGRTSGTRSKRTAGKRHKRGASTKKHRRRMMQAGPGGQLSASGPLAPPPYSVAQAGLLAAMLASSDVSDAALAFYQIPLFLLPIYRAAADQYGVPWEILAAINEVETDYGMDLSVSTAGAVGWMQFMPASWLQYGVDALDAGYADPYNPVDAIFAAARYLRAAGAARDLPAAIFAYNHSRGYVSSVLLRARLIASYPHAVIATLADLADGVEPVSDQQLSWAEAPSAPSGSAGGGAFPGQASSASSGLELTSAPNASVVAVQEGRIVEVGDSPELGRFVVLRDVYGDLFTYSGLGSIARAFLPPGAPRLPLRSVASTPAPAPSQPASAGMHPSAALAPPPGRRNPILPAIAAADAVRARHGGSAHAALLHSGSVVASGTVLGRVLAGPGASEGHLRFAIQPAGDPGTIDPAAILTNWAQLELASHPQGSGANEPGAALDALAAPSLVLAHAARSALVGASALSAAQWNQLMQRIAGLPTPTVAAR